MALNQILKAVSYRISNSTQYLYSCFGSNQPRLIEFLDVNENPCGNFTLDSLGKVYEIVVELAEKNKCYRWIDFEFKNALFNEVVNKGFDPNIAWENIKYTEIESLEDMLIKVEAICKNIPFDERILKPLKLSDDEFLILARMAHEKDVTLNELINLKINDSINSIDLIKKSMDFSNVSQDEVYDILETAILGDIDESLSSNKDCICGNVQKEIKKKKFTTF